ncbi:MAG: translocation/assembly module TamB, partial [Gemmatimonadaceae bacterium]|nr:translocation/assembly module TamB [Gemmatimonadaceae bacterium]
GGGAPARARGGGGGGGGRAPGREGTLTYAVQIDSLAGFQRLFPAADTGVVAPSRARVARALARARADSARLARQTEVERAATGRPPPPRLVVDTVRGIARDSIAGALYAAGTVHGGLPSFNARGRLALRALVFRGNGVRAGRVEYELRNIGTRTPVAAVGARLDSVQAAGLALDSVELRASYRKPGGHVDVAVYQDTGVSYRAAADYALRIDRSEVHLLDVGLRFDTTRWAATHPSTIEWGKHGLAIDSVELRSGTTGRIAVNGRLPDTGSIHLDVQIAGLEIANLIGLAQGDIAASGEIALSAQLTGTRRAPRIRGALGIANATFRGSALPDLRATARYAGTTLTADAELRHGDQAPLATLDATLPVNLALSGVTGARLLEQPMRVDFHADSLPLDGMPSFTDAVAQVRGDLFGAVAGRGTPKHPTLAGRLAVQFASFRVVPMGVTLRQIGGDIHLLGDSIVIDSLVGVSGTGPIALRGGIGIATLTRPSFALRVTGNNALLMDTDRGRLTASANLDVRGPFTRVAITGNARILNGAIYLPAPTGQTVIDLNDSLVYQLVDTTEKAMREVVAPPSPALANLRADVSLVVSHDTWVRTPEANVEIYSTGPLRIQVDSGARALTVDGVMNTDRGEYTYLGRQFVLSHGAVTFTGGPTLDPLLQISAVRNVDLGGRGALAIEIVIGGTARKPTITLSSDAQPPVSQSDLLSYLAFGQSSSSLLQFGGSSGLDGQNASGGQLAGKAAGLATRQLAAVAVDVFAKQLQTNLARSVGADVLNITPADIPTDFSLSSVETLLAGTQVEAGKYVDRQTFVAFQARPTLVAPGIRVERRMRGGYRLQASIEPRFLVRQPTLSEEQTPSATSVFGAFFVREWRF